MPFYAKWSPVEEVIDACIVSQPQPFLVKTMK